MSINAEDLKAGGRVTVRLDNGAVVTGLLEPAQFDGLGIRLSPSIFQWVRNQYGLMGNIADILEYEPPKPECSMTDAIFEVGSVCFELRPLNGLLVLGLVEDHTLTSAEAAKLREWLNGLDLRGPEPTALGSVVTDRDGNEWVRVDYSDIPWREVESCRFENWAGLPL